MNPPTLQVNRHKTLNQLVRKAELGQPHQRMMQHFVAAALLVSMSKESTYIGGNYVHNYLSHYMIGSLNEHVYL